MEAVAALPTLGTRQVHHGRVELCVAQDCVQRLGDRSNGSGVGLGLAVARGFVEAMGGELAVEDTPGGGVTMVISLPVAS